jgi:hypothetical protein
MDIMKAAANYMIRRGQVFIHLDKKKEISEMRTTPVHKRLLRDREVDKSYIQTIQFR